MSRRSSQPDIFPANFGLTNVEVQRFGSDVERTHYLPRQKNVVTRQFQPGIDEGLQLPIWQYGGVNEFLRVAVSIGDDVRGVTYPVVAEARYGTGIPSRIEYVVPVLELATGEGDEAGRLVAATLAGRLVAQALVVSGPARLPGNVLFDQIALRSI